MYSTTRYNALEVATNAELYDTIQKGYGKLIYVMFHVADDDARDELRPRLKIDGELSMPFDSTIDIWLRNLISEGNPGIGVGKNDSTNKLYTMIVNLPIPFERSLEVGFYNSGLIASRIGYVAYIYEATRVEVDVQEPEPKGIIENVIEQLKKLLA